MVCSNCGSTESGNFCTQCGAPLSAAPDTSPIAFRYKDGEVRTEGDRVVWTKGDRTFSERMSDVYVTAPPKPGKPWEIRRGIKTLVELKGLEDPAPVLELRDRINKATSAEHERRKAEAARYIAGQSEEQPEGSRLERLQGFMSRPIGESLGVRQGSAEPTVMVKTYKSPKDYEKDAPRMARDGWVPQGQVASRGRVSVTRTAFKSPLGVGITGLGRKGEKITVTWVRER